MDDLTITTMPLREGALLRISGALSLGRVRHLIPMADRLGVARPQRLVIDLTGCVYLSSLAIGRLLALCDDTDDAGGRVFIACNRTNVMRMLLLCRADLVATIVPTIEDAIVGVGLAGMLDAA